VSWQSLSLRRHDRVPMSSIFWSSVMLPISPLEFLAAFALAFFGGALLAACHCKYVGKVQRDAYNHLHEVALRA
jgi:hypothetical protein